MNYNDRRLATDELGFANADESIVGDSMNIQQGDLSCVFNWPFICNTRLYKYSTEAINGCKMAEILTFLYRMEHKMIKRDKRCMALVVFAIIFR